MALTLGRTNGIDPGQMDDFLDEVDDLAQTDAAKLDLRSDIELVDLGIKRDQSARLLQHGSAALADLLNSDHIDRQAIGTVRAIAATQGEVVARALGKVSTEHQDPATGLTLTAEGEYRATDYGYLCVIEGDLTVRSPLWVDADRMHVYWLVLDGTTHSVTVEMIHQRLSQLGDVAGVDVKKIEELALAIRLGSHKRGLYLIAQGEEAVDGEDTQLEILVDTERHVGQEREDGSIDFHEVNFTPNAKADQMVAWRKPPTEGKPGWDVLGHPIAARDGESRPLRAGRNVEVRPGAEREEYYAKVAGILRLGGDELRVVEQLAIRGDVDFHTGNLKFAGAIHISGSIARGFSVKAGGDVTIGGTIESGASLSTRGDVVTGQGIVGRRTQVVAGGTVRAQYVQEASVTAGQDVLLGSYSYHATLRAGGRVVIARGRGDHSGSIMGGETWGRKGIETHRAGTMHGMASALTAGLNPLQARELDRIQRSIAASNAQMERILNRFALETIDLDQIKALIKAAAGPSRKLLARRARQLGELAQSHQQLVARRRSMTQQLESGQGVEIKVWDRAFPGVTVRVGEHRQELIDEVSAPRFHIKEDELAYR